MAKFSKKLASPTRWNWKCLCWAETQLCWGSRTLQTYSPATIPSKWLMSISSAHSCISWWDRGRSHRKWTFWKRALQATRESIKCWNKNLSGALSTTAPLNPFPTQGTEKISCVRFRTSVFAFFRLTLPQSQRLSSASTSSESTGLSKTFIMNLNYQTLSIKLQHHSSSSNRLSRSPSVRIVARWLELNYKISNK